MAEEEIRDLGTVTFNDVAVYFSSREWDLLAGWQRKLYRNVMKEIHGALAALGYEIANPNILVRVQQEEDPYYSSHDLTDEDYMQDELCSNMKPNSSSDFSDSLPELPNLKPDILLRVKMEEKITEQGCQTNAQDRKVVSTDSNVPVFNPELSLWIKQEDHLAAAKQSSSTEEENEEELSEAPCEPECTRETVQMTKSTRPRLTTNKRTGLKLRDKILVLCAYQNNESVGSLAAQFGVSRSQIVQIIKRRDELISALENNVSGDRIRRRRRTTNDQLNSAVWEWLLSTQDTDIILSGRIIRDKALQIASDMGIRDFKASNGWLDSFKKAHNIHQRSVPIFGAGFGDEKIDEWMAQMRNLDDR